MILSRGGEVVAPGLDDEQRKAFYEAENKAVDLINADFYKYAHHVTAHAKGALQPNELLRAFIRYKHVDYYDLSLFGRAYDWIEARGLTEGQRSTRGWLTRVRCGAADLIAGAPFNGAGKWHLLLGLGRVARHPFS